MNITILELAGILTALVLICGTVAFWVRIIDKVKANTQKLEELEEITKRKDFETRISILEKKAGEIDDTKKAINSLCRAVSALLDHTITGDIERVKTAKKELDEEKDII